MVELTDGNKTIELTKREMELIEDGLRELKAVYHSCSKSEQHPFNVILSKLEGLNYE